MELQLLENRRFTNLFNKSVNLCKQISFFHIFYSCFKIITGIVILSLSAAYNCKWSNDETWIIIVVFESIIEFSLYISLINEFKNISVLLKVAEELHQVIYSENISTIENIDINNYIANPLDDPTADYSQSEVDKKKSLLANQIIWEITKLSGIRKCAKHSVFLINQGLLIWGIIIALQNLWIKGDSCSNVIEVYLIAFLFFTVIQYLYVYFLIVFILICLPFFVIFLIYLKIKQSKKKVDSQKIIDDIKQKNLIKYSPNVIQGDPECKICMQTYQIDENIVKLPCHETHHFHDYCFATWFQLNLSCPVCRKNYAQEDEGVNLQNQQ